jgi:hypothetical protein
VKKEFFVTLKRRLTDMIYKASKQEECPIWIPQRAWPQVKARAEDPKFQAKSAQSKKNRGVPEGGGKAPGTHCNGRRNTCQIYDQMVTS